MNDSRHVSGRPPSMPNLRAAARPPPGKPPQFDHASSHKCTQAMRHVANQSNAITANVAFIRFHVSVYVMRQAILQILREASRTAFHHSCQFAHSDSRTLSTAVMADKKSPKFFQLCGPTVVGQGLVYLSPSLLLIFHNEMLVTLQMSGVRGSSALCSRRCCETRVK